MAKPAIRMISGRKLFVGRRCEAGGKIDAGEQHGGGNECEKLDFHDGDLSGDCTSVLAMKTRESGFRSVECVGLMILRRTGRHFVEAW